MKGLIISGLSSLLLGSFISPVMADEVAMASKVQSFNSPSVGPVTLVGLAAQGFLANQGIPSHLELDFAVKSGRIDAESLVQGGIAAGRLAPNTINNSAYLSQVQFELSQINND